MNAEEARTTHVIDELETNLTDWMAEDNGGQEVRIAQAMASDTVSSLQFEDRQALYSLACYALSRLGMLCHDRTQGAQE